MFRPSWIPQENPAPHPPNFRERGFHTADGTAAFLFCWRVSHSWVEGAGIAAAAEEKCRGAQEGALPGSLERSLFPPPLPGKVPPEGLPAP